MRVKASEVAKVDWSNLDQVIELCKKFGKGSSVIKYPGRSNYNITHTERLNDEAYKGVQVMYIG